MIVKKKICENCKKLSFIWSSKGGVKLCKQCSYTGVAKLSIIKPTAKAKPIPPRSQKRSKEERLYSAKRVLYLQEHPMCEMHLPGICTKYATEIHHTGGRVGADLLDKTKWKGGCHACHVWVTDHPKEAIELGFSIKRIN